MEGSGAHDHTEDPGWLLVNSTVDVVSTAWNPPPVAVPTGYGTVNHQIPGVRYFRSVPSPPFVQTGAFFQLPQCVVDASILTHLTLADYMALSLTCKTLYLQAFPYMERYQREVSLLRYVCFLRRQGELVTFRELAVCIGAYLGYERVVLDYVDSMPDIVKQIVAFGASAAGCLSVVDCLLDRDIQCYADGVMKGMLAWHSCPPPAAESARQRSLVLVSGCFPPYFDRYVDRIDPFIRESTRAYWRLLAGTKGNPVQPKMRSFMPTDIPDKDSENRFYCAAFSNDVEGLWDMYYSRAALSAYNADEHCKPYFGYGLKESAEPVEMWPYRAMLRGALEGEHLNVVGMAKTLSAVAGDDFYLVYLAQYAKPAMQRLLLQRHQVPVSQILPLVRYLLTEHPECQDFFSAIDHWSAMLRTDINMSVFREAATLLRMDIFLEATRRMVASGRFLLVTANHLLGPYAYLDTFRKDITDWRNNNAQAAQVNTGPRACSGCLTAANQKKRFCADCGKQVSKEDPFGIDSSQADLGYAQ